jgi:hypothetical protein
MIPRIDVALLGTTLPHQTSAISEQDRCRAPWRNHDDIPFARCAQTFMRPRVRAELSNECGVSVQSEGHVARAEL